MKKINSLLIGTNNKGKFKEIRELLPKNIKILSTSDFKLKSPREYGSSFEENSFIKSKFFSKKTKIGKIKKLKLDLFVLYQLVF